MLISIPVIIWLLVAVCALIILCWMNIRLFWHLIDMNIKTRQHVKMIKTRTAMQYNKLASLTPTDLDQYLSKLFSLELELATATNISEKDPEGERKLYETAVVRLLEYLGKETIDAIEYYYSEGYIIRWCELRYKYLENSGILRKVLDKDANAKVINTSLPQ